MPDVFVPLPPATFAADNLSFKPLTLSSFPPAPAKSAPATNGAAPSAHPPAPCAQPKITLQRQGDVVTSVRIQCTCGQIIELNCVY